MDEASGRSVADGIDQSWIVAPPPAGCPYCPQGSKCNRHAGVGGLLACVGNAMYLHAATIEQRNDAALVGQCHGWLDLDRARRTGRDRAGQRSLGLHLVRQRPVLEADVLM